ncbi:hypothetical protein KOI35_28435 [Actinoplanes bogorensis]|uniref:Uncharacterized protein n=1 Tax=Paractinoplanes bogorensis TaxID=1610840 RepID=A0ABS5YWJ9_9ACTN|nr:hypothetical protein [Actinoplanes bogorensis]MBU2667446.1 hypothetical protein [Actinoplanes bogorensis]
MRRILAPLLLTGVLLAGGACAAQPAVGQAVDTLLVSADQQMNAQDKAADIADDLKAEGSKKSVAERVDKRLAALKKFQATVDRADHLQPAHKKALTELIAQQTKDLTALRDKTGKDVARSVVVDFRVFILTGPKVRLATAIDTELAAADKLGADDVTKSLNGQVDKLLAIKPGPDAAAIKKQLEPIRTAAKEARTTLKAKK